MGSFCLIDFQFGKMTEFWRWMVMKMAQLCER